jgi:hypothetical protein
VNADSAPQKKIVTAPVEAPFHFSFRRLPNMPIPESCIGNLEPFGKKSFCPAIYRTAQTARPSDE